MSKFDKFKNVGSNQDASFSLNAASDITDAELEQMKKLNEIEAFIERQGLVKRTYIDEVGNERVGVFNSNNSEMTLTEMWEMMDTDVEFLSPEDQRELTAFWDKYHIKFKEVNHDDEVEEKYGEYFSRRRKG